MLSYEKALEALGTVDSDMLSRFLRAMLTDDTSEALKLIEAVRIEGRDLSQFVQDFIWYLRTLQAQGVLHRISGIVMGRPAHNEKYEVYKAALLRVLRVEAKLPDLPVLYNVNVGHAYPIGVFPLGLEYELDCERGSLTLLEPATE